MSEKPEIYWKRRWQIIAGRVKNVSKDEVKKYLFEAKDELIKGVLYYTTKSGKEEKWPEDLHKFVTRASSYLRVDMHVGWRILKSYVLHDFCGAVKSLKKLKYEMQIVPMLSHIWRFYSSERMFKLKTLKVALEYKKDYKHPFSDIYKSLVLDLGYRNIWDSLVKQFQYLIGEMNFGRVDKNCPLKLWMERNLREQIEILHCLIILVEFCDVNIKDFQDFLVIFKAHGFGRELRYFNSTSLPDLNLTTKLRYTEIALLLCIANHFWSTGVDWYDNRDEVNYEITPLSYYEEHGAIVYIWVILHMSLPHFEELFNSQLYKLTQIALNLHVFKFFDDIASHEMFDSSCLVGNNVQEALYNMLFITTTKFDNEGSLYHYVGIVDLTVSLLKNKYLSERFFREENGVICIWNAAFLHFPYDFISASKLAEATIFSNDTLLQKVMDELKHLLVFTDVHNSKIATTARRNQYDLVMLLEDYATEFLPSFKIPKNTQAVIDTYGNTEYIHFKTAYSYWQILYVMIDESIQIGFPDEAKIKSIVAGLKFVQIIIKAEQNSLNVYPVLKRIINSVFSLLNKYDEINVPVFPLLSIAMDICSELARDYSDYVYSLCDRVQIFPSLMKPHFEYDEMFKLDFVNQHMIGHNIIQAEKNVGQQMLLISYLNLLRSVVKFNDSNGTILEQPGLVFVLKEVFPHFMFWYSKQEKVLQDVLYHSIHFIFEIFLLNQEKFKNPVYVHMRKITFLCFLNETCGRCLLRILAIGNGGLLQIMENQTNWQTGRGVRHIAVLQKVMSILMQLLTLGRNVTNITVLTPLENLIYTENDTMKTVKAVASFLNNPFNEAIPNISCRLLKKLTIELQMSVLASLELEPDQVRTMFIQRLRDRLENDDLKLAIIELITTCIPKQSGMTEAFFKVSESSLATFSKEKKDKAVESSVDEGIGTFIVEYLIKFNTGNPQIHMPLMARIIELLCVLWINQKEILIAELIKDKHFWPSVSYPIVFKVPFSNKTYAEILNIIAKELHKKNGNVDKCLLDILTTFFSSNSKHLDHWIEYIFYTTEDTLDQLDKSFAEVPSAASLMVSWKDFLIIAVRVLPSTLFTPQVQVKLATACRHALKRQILYLESHVTVTFLTELYMFFMANWSDVCINEDNLNLFSDISNILQKVALDYQDLTMRFKEAFLTIVISMLYKTKSPFTLESSVQKELTEAMVQIFDHEYALLTYRKDIWDSTKEFKSKEHNSFMMCFAALNKLILMESSNYRSWLVHTQLINKLINCIRRFLKSPYTLPLAKIALETLTYYANSSNSKDFFYTEFSVLLLEDLVPPKQYQQLDLMNTIKELPWDLKAWWVVFRRILILLIVLLKKHRYKILKDIIMFVSLHKDYITEILLLQRYVMDTTALDLIITTLGFLHELLKYKNEWHEDHEESLLHILDATKMALNCSSGAIIRPNVIRYFIRNSSGQLETPVFDLVPTEAIAEVIEKLTDIVIMTTRCILVFSPPLYDMLRDRTDYQKWTVQVGTSFGLPKIGIDDSSELTFGSLICVSCLYVRILQQGSNLKRQGMTPPREILIARKTRTSSTSKSDAENKSSKTISTSTEEKEGDGKSEETLVKKSLNTQSHETIIGFFRLDYFSPIPNIFTSYATPARVFPWFANLNENKSMYALESLLTLLTSQISLIMIHNRVEKATRRLLRRELFSELQIFHEFVKKKLPDTYRYSFSNNSYLLRRKIGFLEYDKNESIQVPVTAPNKTILHKENQFSSNKNNSNKRSVDSNKNASTSTTSGIFLPDVVQPSTSSTKPMKFSSEVKLSNEDYLHLISLWFMYVLRTHK